ncbi:MAG TPA: hypothetical protein VMV49_01870 [Candidatus Deferrimicrobium sp.]|nr:hypothetical protein [Candidatus Deferrimicrobium sp.]
MRLNEGCEPVGSRVNELENFLKTIETISNSVKKSGSLRDLSEQIIEFYDFLQSYIQSISEGNTIRPPSSKEIEQFKSYLHAIQNVNNVLKESSDLIAKDLSEQLSEVYTLLKEYIELEDKNKQKK